MTPCPDASTLRLGPIFQVPLDKLSYLELQVLYTERIIPRSGLAGKFCGQFRDIFQVLTQGLPLRLIFPVGMREIIHGHSSLDRTELARAPRAHAMGRLNKNLPYLAAVILAIRVSIHVKLMLKYPVDSQS